MRLAPESKIQDERVNRHPQVSLINLFLAILGINEMRAADKPTKNKTLTTRANDPDASWPNGVGALNFSVAGSSTSLIFSGVIIGEG